MRSTIEIKTLLEYANAQLERRDEFATSSFKAGVCVMIERALFEANAYSGFHFLTEDDKPEDESYWSRHYYLPLELR